MAVHDGFQRIPLQVWTGKRPRIKQHITNVPGKDISIPYAKVQKLVPAEKYPLEVQLRQRVIDPTHPLRHAGVVRVFCFEGEVEKLSA
jgi:hypothetical protein